MACVVDLKFFLISDSDLIASDEQVLGFFNREDEDMVE
jgi:hypothetical protein